MPRVFALRNDRRGIALPVSLLGLILISILITGVLTTGSTEAAMSVAHRDATRDLYAAEGGIEAFIALQNVAMQPMTNFTFTPGTGQDPVRVTVEELARFTDTSGDQPARNTHFSVFAQRAGGGRGVVAMIRVRQTQLNNLATNVNAAFTLGGDAAIAGTAPPKELYKISDGSDSKSCDPDSAADHAILYANEADVTLTKKAQDETKGKITKDSRDKHDLISELLGGVSMRDIGWNADIKFGRYFNEPAYDANLSKIFSVQNKKANTKFPNYDWSCPGMMDTAQNCWQYHGSWVDTTYYPVVAIDGENRDVEITNWHGQGMLIVINGTLRITGQFVYKGLILAERNVILAGGGATSPTIEGAIVSAGQLIVDPEEDASDPDSQASGNAQIRFNRCAINAVQTAFNNRSVDGWGSPQVQGSTFNWFEVVR